MDIFSSKCLVYSQVSISNEQALWESLGLWVKVMAGAYTRGVTGHTDQHLKPMDKEQSCK